MIILFTHLGTGQTCVRGSGTQCGDGNDAKLAMLTNPKGKLSATNQRSLVEYQRPISCQRSNISNQLAVSGRILARLLIPLVTQSFFLISLCYYILMVGITVNALGEIYFVDDTTIRKIGLDGKIDTVIGTQDLPGQYVPMPCGRAADLYEVSELE